MKKVLILLAAILSLNGIAQIEDFPYDFEIGQEYKRENKNHAYHLFGNKEVGYFCYREANSIFSSTHSLQSYTGDMTLIMEKEIEINSDIGYLHAWEPYFLKGRLWIVCFKQTKEKNKYAFVQEFDLKTLEPKGAPIPLSCCITEFKKTDLTSINLSISSDSSKIVVYSLNHNPEKNESVREFIVFDDNFHHLYTKTIVEDHQEVYEYMNKVLVTSEGDVYAFKLHKAEGTGDIYKIREEGDPVSFKMNSFEKHAREFVFYETDKDIFYFAICTENEYEMMIEGTVAGKISKDDLKQRVELHEQFDFNDLVHSHSYDNLSIDLVKGKFEIHGVETLNGQVILLLENVAEGVSNDGTSLIYGDVMMVNFKPNLEVNWIQKIAKYQNMLGDQYEGNHESINHFLIGDHLYVFHQEKPFTGHLVINRIDNTGNKEVYVLEHIKEERFLFRPLAILLEGNHVVLPIESKSKMERLINVTIDH